MTQTGSAQHLHESKERASITALRVSGGFGWWCARIDGIASEQGTKDGRGWRGPLWSKWLSAPVFRTPPYQETRLRKQLGFLVYGGHGNLTNLQNRIEGE
jgi:hypothetical protein